MPEAPSFEALLQEALPHMLAFARSLTRGSADAEDIVHDVAIRLLVAREQYQPETSFRAWAITAVRNRYIDIARRRRRFDGGSIDDLDGDSVVFSRPALQDEAVWCEEVGRAFARLPRLYQDLLGAVVAGATYEELARIHRCPVGTIRSRITRPA